MGVRPLRAANSLGRSAPGTAVDPSRLLATTRRDWATPLASRISASWCTPARTVMRSEPPPEGRLRRSATIMASSLETGLDRPLPPEMHCKAKTTSTTTGGSLRTAEISVDLNGEESQLQDPTVAIQEPSARSARRIFACEWVELR